MSTKIKTQEGWKWVAGGSKPVKIIKKRMSIHVSVSTQPGYSSFNINWPEAFPDDTYMVNLILPNTTYWAQITSKILYKTSTGVQVALGFVDGPPTSTIEYSGTMVVDAVWVGQEQD